MSGLVEEVRGNRKVPPAVILGTRGDLSGAWAEAWTEREGGSRRKSGFPRASEPQAREETA